ncbi:hypothetical protein ETB97_001142 [Aspergillus alliaceus]|uniref:Uncharacterized protein n=1 Tax=Petromyces alliaceus TaxID=209559 RepID=A0A8H6AE03_PETAA|nr:hypothetical protein ETB97_001142 [Aspergillus burnettii]
MAAMLPLGFGIGAPEGGTFIAHLHWVFGSTAILCALFTIAVYWGGSNPSSILRSDARNGIIGDIAFPGIRGIQRCLDVLRSPLFLTIQDKAPIVTALYVIHIAMSRTIATIVVAKTLHVFPGYYILTSSMIAFALGPAFFLPQTSNAIYWALSFPGIILVVFVPDISFAAASIFVPSKTA